MIKKFSENFKTPEQRIFFEALYNRQNDAYYSAFADFEGGAFIQRVFGAWHISAENIDETALFLKMHRAREITGDEKTVSGIAEFFGGMPKSFPLLKYQGDSVQEQSGKDGAPEIKIASTIEEHKSVYSLLRDTETFDMPEFEEYYTARRSIEKLGAGETVFVEENGVAVCTASIVCESRAEAILGSVATAKEHRGKGLAGAAVLYLAKKLSENGKNVYIACYNPAAVRVYKRVGFVDFGEKFCYNV